MTARRPTGMAAFTVIWLGQILSSGGTRMVNFALAIWIWQKTGRTSDLALMTLLAFAATVLVSPFVGGLIDRWSRRTSVVASDLGSLVATLVALGLFASGHATFWALLCVNTVTGAFLAFQYPAYSTLIASLLDKDQYTRANGMLSMVRSAPAIFAPGLAGVLMSFSGVSTVLVVASVCYVVAIGTVFLVALPGAPEGTQARKASFWHDSTVGFRHLLQVPGYAGLQAMLFIVGLVSAMGFIVLTPLVLIKTGSESQLGAVNSIGAVGGVIGAIALSALKAPKRKMPRILIGVAVFSVFGRVLMGVGDSFVVWAVAWFVSWMSVPFMEGYTLAIWQQKIPPEIQGRVFAAIQFISQLALLVGFSATGPLVDAVLEPQTRPGHSLSTVFGPIVGTQPGAGMKLVFLLSGIAGILSAVLGVASRRVRNMEIDVPDYSPPAEPQSAEQPDAEPPSGEQPVVDRQSADGQPTAVAEMAESRGKDS
jgi:DHA3 family macrolide efflux protein-like MFS transporter